MSATFWLIRLVRCRPLFGRNWLRRLPTSRVSIIGLVLQTCVRNLFIVFMPLKERRRYRRQIVLVMSCHTVSKIVDLGIRVGGHRLWQVEILRLNGCSVITTRELDVCSKALTWSSPLGFVATIDEYLGGFLVTGHLGMWSSG